MPKPVQFQAIAHDADVRLILLYDNGVIVYKDVTDEDAKWMKIDLPDPIGIAAHAPKKHRNEPS